MRIAAIDIGSNSIHMVVVDVLRRQELEVIDREKTFAKLGAGAFSNHRLSKSAMENGLETLGRYRKLADSLAADEILAVATSAIRDTENGGSFLSLVSKQLGFEAQLISGIEEARLIYRGVRSSLDIGDEKVLVLDIGGGSVEIIGARGPDVVFRHSLKLGVQRLRDMMGDAPLTPPRRRKLEAHVTTIASSVMSEASRFGFTRVVGTSGTIRAMGDAAHRAAGGEPWRTLNAEEASVEDMKRLTNKLVQLDHDARVKIKGVDPQRADTIHLGAVLLMRLASLGGIKRITLCDASLREGVVLDHVDKMALVSGPGEIPDLRPRSVARLARKYGQTTERQQHISKLALQLFDQTQVLHGRGESTRELLDFAAQLFSVGQHIGFRSYHQHSHYIIVQSGIRGFTDQEVEQIALIVRFHRKAEPSKKHPSFKGLDTDARADVRLQSAILRLAVALDRGNSQSVSSIHCVLSEEQLRLELTGEGDLEVPMWAGRRRSESLGRALGVEVKIERSSPSLLGSRA